MKGGGGKEESRHAGGSGVGKSREEEDRSEGTKSRRKELGKIRRIPYWGGPFKQKKSEKEGSWRGEKQLGKQRKKVQLKEGAVAFGKGEGFGK